MFTPPCAPSFSGHATAANAASHGHACNHDCKRYTYMADLGVWLASQAGRWQELEELRELSPELFDPYTLKLALRIAAANDHAGVVRVLVRAGASISGVGDFVCQPTPLFAATKHDSALFAATKHDSADAARALLETKASTDDCTPITAAAHGADSCLKMLVLAKADLAACDVFGYSAVSTAAGNGQIGTLRLLLQTKACVAEGAPVTAAAQCGHLDVVTLLLSAKADIDAASYDGQTPVFAAACYGHVTVLRLLLRAKADATRRTGRAGRCPLFIAAVNGHVAAVQCLLAHDPALATVVTLNGCKELGRTIPAGSTPLDVSRQFHRDDIASLLMAATAAVTQLN